MLVHCRGYNSCGSWGIIIIIMIESLNNWNIFIVFK